MVVSVNFYLLLVVSVDLLKGGVAGIAISAQGGYLGFHPGRQDCRFFFPLKSFLLSAHAFFQLLHSPKIVLMCEKVILVTFGTTNLR